jgi:hypothetical protein
VLTIVILWTLTAGEPSGGAAASTSKAVEPSAAWQSRVEARYREFEGTLSRLADLLRPQDPARAALLTRAFSESRKELVASQLQELVKKMDQGDYAQAMTDQGEVLESMTDILELLLDEGRAESRQADRQKLQEQLREAKRLSTEQRQLREQTEQAKLGDAPQAEQLSKSQQQLADQTKELAEKMRGESPTGEASTKNSASSPKPNESNPSPTSSTSKEASRSPSMESAQQAMQKAQEKLNSLKKEEATREQTKAIEELEKTIEELQKMIEQQREEERQELLERLESRLREIKATQEKVLEGTREIDRRPERTRTRGDEQALTLWSKTEGEVVEGLEQILAILLEDGTAVAFPETMEQLARDAQDTQNRLAQFQTGPATQRLQEDIIATLAEMIDALQKAKSSRRKESQASSPAGGKSGRNPLVEQLAELKMIRSLQLRINERTEAIEKQLGQTGSLPSDARGAIEELADRQHRVYQITRSVAEGASP